MNMVDGFHILASVTAHPQELLSPDDDSYQLSQFLSIENSSDTLDTLAADSISAVVASQGALGTPLRLSVSVSIDNLRDVFETISVIAPERTTLKC